MAMDFLKDYKKTVNGMEGVSTDASPPRYWFSTGNYVLNGIMGTSFDNALPQGRMTTICGFSGAGKSFLCGNILKAAQEAGAFILVIDTENALDDAYLQGIGVSTDSDVFSYASPTTIPQAVKVISAFMKGYKKEYKYSTDAPKVVICIDSLDMLMTQSDYDHYVKGETSGDQGQQMKQIKSFLRSIVQDIKGTNVSCIVTKQVYKGQGMFADPAIVTEAIKYSSSQIVMVTKLKLKDAENNQSGIRMKCEVLKTRFCKPFQSVIINVPYLTGMDEYSGLVDVATGLGIIEGKTWYTIKDTDIKVHGEAKLIPYYPLILEKCKSLSDRFILASVESDEIDTSDIETAKSKRDKKGSDLTSTTEG